MREFIQAQANTLKVPGFEKDELQTILEFCSSFSLSEVSSGHSCSLKQKMELSRDTDN